MSFWLLKTLVSCAFWLLRGGRFLSLFWLLRAIVSCLLVTAEGGRFLSSCLLKAAVSCLLVIQGGRFLPPSSDRSSVDHLDPETDRDEMVCRVCTGADPTQETMSYSYVDHAGYWAPTRQQELRSYMSYGSGTYLP